MSTQTQLNQSGTEVLSAPRLSASLGSNEQYSLDGDISNMIDEMQEILDSSLMEVFDEDDIDDTDIKNSNHNHINNNNIDKNGSNNCIQKRNNNTDDKKHKQPKLHSLIHQITNANDVTDIEPIINRLNAFDDIKLLLLDKINQLPLYDETKKEDDKLICNGNTHVKNIKFNENNIIIDINKEENEDEKDIETLDDTPYEMLDDIDDDDNELINNNTSLIHLARSFSINNLYYQCTE
eukprot:242003_1